MNNSIILAISAASGVVYGLKTLRFLLKQKYNVDLIISKNAYYIAKQELGLELEHDSSVIKNAITKHLELPNNENLKVWLNDELWADPASGSSGFSTMIISPASMSTVAAIAAGLSDNLIERAADVIIKESKNLVIVPRECPFSAIHLENMLKLARLGVKIVPPIPGHYSEMKTVDDCVDFVAGKTLDSCNIPNQLYRRWGEE